MKPIIYIFMAIFVISLASAFPAGTQQIIYNFDKCDSLRVDVTGTLHIDESEYWFVGCNETENNSWYCDCTDDYNLTLDSDVRAKNNYTFTMTYNWSEESQSTTKRSSGGGSGGTYYPHIKSTQNTSFYLFNDDKDYFYLNGQRHSIKFLEKINGKYKFEINSETVIVYLKEGESKYIFLDNISIKIGLEKVTNSYYKVNMIKQVNDTQVNDTQVNDTQVNDTQVNDTQVNDTQVNDTQVNDIDKIIKIKEDKSMGLFTLIILIVVLFILSIVIYKKYKKRNNNETLERYRTRR